MVVMRMRYTSYIGILWLKINSVVGILIRTISYNNLTIALYNDIFILMKLTGRIQQVVIYCHSLLRSVHLSIPSEQKRQLQNSCNFINNYTSFASHP